MPAVKQNDRLLREVTLPVGMPSSQPSPSHDVTLIETRRTILRPFSEQDAPLAFAWFGDTDVMRYTGGADASVAATRERIARYQNHQERAGFSKWLVVDKQTHDFIGDAGLLVLPDVGPLPDLGYRLVRARWGQGLASEIAAAWISMAFTTLNLTGVSAFAHVDHKASHRVLEKSGFERTGRRIIMGIDAYAFVRLNA